MRWSTHRWEQHSYHNSIYHKQQSSISTIGQQYWIYHTSHISDNKVESKSLFLIIILDTKNAVQQIYHRVCQTSTYLYIKYSDNKLFDLCGLSGVNDPCLYLNDNYEHTRASLHELALTPVQPVLVLGVGIILHCPWWTVPGISDKPAADPLLCILCMPGSDRTIYRSLSLSLPTYQEGCYIL